MSGRGAKDSTDDGRYAGPAGVFDVVDSDGSKCSSFLDSIRVCAKLFSLTIHLPIFPHSGGYSKRRVGDICYWCSRGGK